MKSALRRLLTDYGMLFVLVLLGAFFSWATVTDQQPAGAAAAPAVAAELKRRVAGELRVLIVTGSTGIEREFGGALRQLVGQGGGTVLGEVAGQPAEARAAVEAFAGRDPKPNAIACSVASGQWSVFETIQAGRAWLQTVPVVAPRSYRWPSFLKADNLLNVANQIAVIAIIAIGMTTVIIAGGIDLSVGSLIALSAVLCTLAIRDVAGGEGASALGMVLCCAAAIVLCGLVGLASGFLVTTCGVPPFIATLAMMLMASGLAFIGAKGQSIYQVPESFIWLGRGAAFGVPNAVWLMACLYVLAHLVMTRTVLGRQIYAVGGNPVASRLSGVPVRRVLVITYVLSAALAGLGGVVMASQLKSGSPTYGQMYELYVIAAVVVGGTSLSGGRGQVLGTIIGAFIIAVIRNGMNLTGVESYTQMVVLGLVILGAVLLDRLRHHSSRFWAAA